MADWVVTSNRNTRELCAAPDLPMNVTAISASDLTPDQVAQWRHLQAAYPWCAGPHFSPEFVQAVAAVREGVEVGVLTDRGETVGIIPYRRTKGDIGRPIADNFSDLQGWLVPPQIPCTADELIRKFGLNALHFTNVPTACHVLAPFAWRRKEAFFIDVSDGFEAYRLARRRAGSGQMQRLLRKARKLERDVGQLHFEPRSTSAELFRAMIASKRAQLRSRKLGDSFSGPWALPLLERIMQLNTEDCLGMMSVVRVGTEVLAIHLGMRSRDVFHGWVTTYNSKYAKFSPGLLMVAELARHAERSGIRRLDMGSGAEAFKRGLASGSCELLCGAIDVRPVARIATHGWMMAKEMLRDTPINDAARAAVRRLRNVTRPVAPELEGGLAGEGSIAPVSE